MITATGITKKFGDTQVLKGVNLSIAKGEVVSVAGASGAGKSTLLHILGTLMQADAGTVTLDGTDISKLSGTRLSKFRNAKIGFVFQFHQLLPEFTSVENAALPALISGLSKKESFARAEEILKFLGMGHRLTNKPGQLSGGEQQRVAVARALVNKPAVVMADEPSGNLDSANAEELHKLFFKLRDEMGQTFLIVTHNEQLAQMSDRILTMKDGTL